MASRKEQKEALRREREQREAAAKAAQRRRQLIGYGAGGAFVVAVLAVLVVLLAGGGGGGDGQASANSDVLPDGGSVPAPQDEEPGLEAAVEAAGGELESFRATSREHTADPGEAVEYESSPPTSGRHFQAPAEDGAYEQPPSVTETVHSLEHGRIVIWFKLKLPEQARASLKALYDEDPYQLLLVPDTTEMPYDVAVSAWNRDPQPNGTGRLLGLPEYNERIFDAIRAFKDEHRSNGPEPIP